MKRTLTMTCMGISTLIFAATTLDAQQHRNCGPHAAVIAHLAEVYSETRQMIGLAANNSVLEVFAAESGSWTILVTTPGGPACVVAAGENFQLTDETLSNYDPEA